MKIPYRSLPFKTNRNALVQFDATSGVTMNRLPRLSNVDTVEMVLPTKLYHVSTTPLSSFKKDRIFYVSFDKFQSVAHGLSITKDDIHPLSEKKLYFYTLRPKKKKAKVVLFDAKTRPKKVSNALGAKYNVLTNAAMGSLGLTGNMRSNNVIQKNFKEGSGDNMILGQIVCDSLKVNGIRNSYDQDELAVCNPVAMFDVTDRKIIHLKNVDTSVRNIKFNRSGPMRYTHEYEKNIITHVLGNSYS